MVLEIILLIKKLTWYKTANHLKLRLSFLLSIILKKTIIWGKFESLTIEPINLCNLNCIECPTGTNSLTRKKGEINLELAKTIIQSNKKYLSYLILYFQGEPFLAKNIFSIIKYANENNIFTYTSTNGHFLTQQNCEKIIESKLDKLIISVDGATQETYEIYRKNGNLNKVLEGIKTLVDEKLKRSSTLPFIELQFLVFKHNEHQIKEMKQLGKLLKINKISIKTAQFYNSNNYKYLTQITKYSRYNLVNGKLKIKKKLKNSCWRMWHSAVITIEGDVVPCCFDKNAKHTYVNVEKIDIKEIRNLKEYKQYSTVILKNRKNIDICNNCSE